MATAEEIIAALDLSPLEGEGGYFRRTWFQPGTDAAPVGSVILYLITPDSFSALHRLYADEVFHFYLGDPCEQIVIHPDHSMATNIIGSDILAGQQVQTIVPKNTWQGTRLVPGGSWALVGTTMAPGFYSDGFELASLNDIRHMPIEISAIATSYLADGA